eukprot:11899739-Karenia_brevis.AAC.1
MANVPRGDKERCMRSGLPRYPIPPEAQERDRQRQQKEERARAKAAAKAEMQALRNLGPALHPGQQEQI